jgi:hypothetical protein
MINHVNLNLQSNSRRTDEYKRAESILEQINLLRPAPPANAAMKSTVSINIFQLNELEFKV